MKIAYLPGTYFPDPGGAQVQVHNLANRLIEEDNEVKFNAIKLMNKY